jgi:3-oxoacyl-[acyl-carrier-protein] synthase II
VTTAYSERTSTSIAITGLGVLTPLGDSPASLAEALRAGRRAIEAAPDLGGSGQSRMNDFEATRYANIRGMRIYNRATRLGICATKLALVDSGFQAAGLPGEQLGLVTASTFGHLDTLIEYDRSLVTAGLQRTNPAWMPLAIPSAPGAVIALSFGAKAFSITLSDSGASSLDAVGLGARLLEGGRARACIVVGAFAICDELSLAAFRAGMLAPAEDFRVFDRRCRGTALGEAAAAVVLERLEDARDRGAEPKALVHGQASAFATRASDMEGGLRRACEGALRASALTPAQVGLISAGANGLPNADRAEARALVATLGDTAARTPVMAPKANLGETIDAGGLLQSLVALSALRSGTAPPIAQLEEPEVHGLRYLQQESPVDSGYALVTSMSISGACSALVLSARRES